MTWVECFPLDCCVWPSRHPDAFPQSSFVQPCVQSDRALSRARDDEERMEKEWATDRRIGQAVSFCSPKSQSLHLISIRFTATKKHHSCFLLSPFPLPLFNSKAQECVYSLIQSTFLVVKPLVSIFYPWCETVRTNRMPQHWTKSGFIDWDASHVV